VVRALRLMRVFRVLKFAHHVDEARVLAAALRSSFAKITVFLLGVLSVVMIMGTLMYLVEGSTADIAVGSASATATDGHITNIPEGMYWAIVTMTTVGYGDFTPHSAVGRMIAAMLMLIGYSVLAVPTGIVSMEYTNARVKSRVTTRSCAECLKEGHDPDAVHCKFCGAKL
jgi:voltage-gated potassium channel